MAPEATVQNGTSANPDQLAIIKHTEGPLLVIAGPGSGKTFTLVERVIHLVTEKSVKPENLFVATFTEKAAKELMTRISNRLLEKGIKFNINEMYLGTIHSICLRILEENREFTRLKRNYTLMDQFDQQYFIYQHMREYDALTEIDWIPGLRQPQSRWKRSQNLIRWINKISEEAIDPGRLKKDPNQGVRAVAAAYDLYQRQLEEENALDFSTIQLETLHLLENHPAVLEKLSQTIHYIMIDEYQDTNTVQEAIILKLAGAQKNVCVVGDDDQGLYRFRGATIRNILEFPANFPPGVCATKKLVTNYRSHPDIINFYNEWMNRLIWSDGKKNFRYSKTIEPCKAKFPKIASAFRVSGQAGQDNWHDEVLAFLQHLKANLLTDWNQVAFLFRSVRGEKAVDLAAFLEKSGIPVYSPRSNVFFERTEVRLMIGALLFLFPQYGKLRQWEDGAHLEIWEYFDACLLLFANQLRKPENKDLAQWCKLRAKEHLSLTQNADYGFSGLFYQLLQFDLFASYLQEQDYRIIIDERPARNLANFSQLLVKFEYLHHVTVLSSRYLEKNIIDLFNQFFRYLKEGGMNEYEDEAEYAPRGCVSFLTIHQSKGLEFPVVIVGSLENTPRKQYDELDVILQGKYYRKPPFEPIERTKEFDFWRLYYTAFSRAQNFLVLTCQEKVSAGQHQRKVPSAYFEQLYRALPTWRSIKLDRDVVTLAQIKDVNLKQEYSFTSHIILYETCARQYRFYKDLAFSPVRQGPILFGTLVHQTIEDIHKAVLREETSKINPQQIEEWFHSNYQNLSKKERVYLSEPVRNTALDQVLRYAERNRGEWPNIREAEVQVALVKDRYILTGTIDLIKGTADTVEIIDFKSEHKPDLVNERTKIDRYKRQLEIYAHVVEERLGLNVSKMHLYYTAEKDSNPMLTFNKDDQKICETIAVVDQTVERIEKKDFALRHVTGKQCEDCDIRHFCKAH